VCEAVKKSKVMAYDEVVPGARLSFHARKKIMHVEASASKGFAGARCWFSVAGPRFGRVEKWKR
jgi:hypothetical protein